MKLTKANFEIFTDTKMTKLGSHTFTGTVRRAQVKILARTAYVQFIFPGVIYIHLFTYSLAVGNVPVPNRPLLYIEFRNQIKIYIYIFVFVTLKMYYPVWQIQWNVCNDISLPKWYSFISIGAVGAIARNVSLDKVVMQPLKQTDGLCKKKRNPSVSNGVNGWSSCTNPSK